MLTRPTWRNKLSKYDDAGVPGKLDLGIHNRSSNALGCGTAPANYSVNPSVRPVTPRACARVAPVRPAGFADRWADDSRVDVSATVEISGWKVGLQKVEMTKALKAQAGLSLVDAKKATDEVVKGGTVTVTVRTQQHAIALRDALIALGATAQVGQAA